MAYPKRVSKIIKIEADIADGSFYASGASYSLSILDYDYNDFVSWFIGKLILSIGKGEFREVVYSMLQISHLWFLYHQFTKEE